MNILLVASEAGPFIKTGGLGDVMGALPKELAKKGHDVRVVIPNYKGILGVFKEKFEFVKWFNIKVGWRERYVGLVRFYYNGVNYYFIDNQEYFGREGLYGYYDDGERFAYFDRAVLTFLRQINWRPDVIHCNDWQTGMIPVMLRMEFSRLDDFY